MISVHGGIFAFGSRTTFPSSYHFSHHHTEKNAQILTYLMIILLNIMRYATIIFHQIRQSSYTFIVTSGKCKNEINMHNKLSLIRHVYVKKHDMLKSSVYCAYVYKTVYLSLKNLCMFVCHVWSSFSPNFQAPPPWKRIITRHFAICIKIQRAHCSQVLQSSTKMCCKMK